MELVWSEIGERFFETGVSHGVFYTRDTAGAYTSGVVWNGLTAITESPSGAESTPLFADNIKYLNLQSVEEFGATIEAFTFPDEFAECDGSKPIVPGVYIGQQPRKSFGLSYQTILGNDVELNNFGYKIHLIYGAIAAPSEKAYSTVNDSPEAITFSWELSTTPVSVKNFQPTASLTIISTEVDAIELKALEDILYGTNDPASIPRLPLPDEVAAIFKNGTVPAQG